MELLLPQFGLFFWPLFILFFGLFLFALIDVLRNQFEGANTKLIWVLVIILIPALGSLLYLLIGKKGRIKEEKYSLS